MDRYVGPMTGAVIDNIIKEIKKKPNKEKIMKHIVDPLLKDLTTRYYPHFITITAILVIIVLMLIVILIVILLNKKNILCD